MSNLNRSAGTYPVEPKVQAATAASYVASAVVLAFVEGIQNEGSLLLGPLPDWLEALVLPVLPALLTFAAGWAAKHQHRNPAVPLSGGTAG